jgi:hypothetical protein
LLFVCCFFSCFIDLLYLTSKEREEEFLAKFGEEIATEKKKETIEKLEKEAEAEAERRSLPVRRIGDREKKDKYLKSLPKLQFNLRVREYVGLPERFVY